MEIEQYTNIFNIENDLFWYKGLRDLVKRQLDLNQIDKDNSLIFDAGCGTGKLLETLYMKKNIGMDISDAALYYTKKRKLSHIVKGDINRIPIANNVFDMIISLDVLCHKGVNEDNAVSELYRILSDDGRLILNLPAYNFLKAGHDEIDHTHKRYTLKDVKRNLLKAGFKIELITYHVTFLFPLALVSRLVSKISKKPPRSDVKPFPWIINIFFTMVLLFENYLICHGFRFPFGLSVFCIARKGN